MERTTICISAARGWRWKQPDATSTIAPRSRAPRPPSLLSQPPFNRGLRFLPLIRTVVMAPHRALSAATVSAIAASAVMAVLSAAAAPAAAAPIMARDGTAIIAAAPLVDLKVFPNDEDTTQVDAADASGLSTTARVGPVEEEVDAAKPAGQTDGEDDLEKGPVVRANDDVAADKAAGGDAQTDGEDDLKADAARDVTDDEVEVVLPEMEPTSAPDEDQVDAEDDPVVELVDVLDEAAEEIPIVEAST